MGSLKALQEWCRIQCEDYHDVEVRNMSSSFRDGLAFCAIIHRFRPDLMDFSSLSKENVYENNRLAFEVAESQLGIPALLDPEDMVSMKVPDRLSIITYVSQYYNFFTNKSQANPPCMKRPAGPGQSQPAQKRLLAPPEDGAAVESESAQPAQTGLEADLRLRCSTLSSTCTACLKHVHLVQRFMVDGKLYHRNCFRCRECSSTLLPGSYKMGKESGSLICTHHFTRPALADQNGRPDLSKWPVEVRSARIGRSPSHHQAPPPESGPESAAPPAVVTNDSSVLAGDSLAEDTPTSTTQSDSLIIEEEASAPPNPFGESDDDGGGGGDDEEETKEAEKEKEEVLTPVEEPPNAACHADDPPATPVDPPATPVSHSASVARPVPAPRRVPEATPPPRPAPRARPQHTPDRQEVNGERLKPLLPPKPRERSRSPGSQSIDTPKSKDPPWLALVQSEPKKKPAPPPPPAGLATPPRAGSMASLKAEGSRPGTPPPPANPFDDDDDDDDDAGGDKEVEQEGGGAPAPVVASHPWYRITQAAEAGAADTPPSGGSSSRSASPGGGKGKRRPAPRAPQAAAAQQALSVESLSSGSDHSSSQASGQEHLFSKSVSEPSISGPGDPAASPASCSDERLPHLSLSTSPPATPANTSSAPATPQTNRSSGTWGPRHAPPPRPPTTAPSPLASETAAASNNKRTCKENPFNRKASPAHANANAKARPPCGPRPTRPPAPGHGFPLIKRKVQSDQYIPTEDIHGEMSQLEGQLDQLEQRGVELESKLRDNPSDEEEERLLVEWFTLINDKHLLVRREAELVYTAKQQNLEERQADVEYELRCLLNKPEKDWSEEDRGREQELMADLVTIIEQRNQIINNMDQDRQRDEEEDKLMAAMLKKKDFHKEPDGEEEDKKKKKKKKGAKFKPMKVLKRLSHKGDPSKTPSPHKDKS